MTHCTECGKDINSADKFCGHCGRFITNNAFEGQSNEPILINNANDYTPLTGNDRIKVTSFFIILALGSVFLVGIIPMLIIVGNLYSMNKDVDYSHIAKSKIYIVWYVAIVGYGISIFILKTVFDKWGYGTWEGVGYAILWTSGTYILTNYAIPKLYFDILEKHKSWVVRNGIYGD